MISCILLSAGLSSRFGSPKALAKLNNLTVIEYLLRNLVESKLDEIIVVIGAHADEIKLHILNHKKVRVVYNKDYNLGQTSSFKVGVGAIQSQGLGIMLLPVDFPLIKRQTFDKLLEHFLAESPKILIPTYHQRKGHPPVFGPGFKKLFLDMDDSVGINALQHECGSDIVLLPVEDPGVVRSFNTPEEFNEVKSSFL